VHLVLVDGAERRVAPTELAKVVVMARDSAGRAWLARVVRPGWAAFDALPPGRYTMDLDVTGADEPLHAARELPVFRVSDGGESPTMEIPLRARAIRIRQMSSTSNDAPNAASPPTPAATGSRKP
jgi:hypothetical protein